jgi:hypothetical protein
VRRTAGLPFAPWPCSAAGAGEYATGRFGSGVEVLFDIGGLLSEAPRPRRPTMCFAFASWSGETSETTKPDAPARPVRPERCT